MDILTQIKDAAQAARQWVVNYRNKEAREFPPDLCGLCAIATFRLCHELEARGLTPVAVVEDNDVEGHCYAEVDGYVVDVTATQFGESPIYIKRLNQRTKFVERAKKRKCYSLPELVALLKKNEWPMEQRPCAVL